MTQRIAPFALLLGAALLAAVLPTAAQVPPPGQPAGPPPRPTVFVDGPGTDIEFLRSEIPFVEFVPELAAARIHVVITPAGPPEQGRLRLEFIGLKNFQGDNNVLDYVPTIGASPEETRKGLAETLKLGLLRYAAKTPVAKDLSVKFLDQAKPTSVNDPWHSWVFSLSGNAFLMGETQYREDSYYASFSANRVTPALKVQTQVYGNWSHDWFDLGGGDIYTALTHGYGGSCLTVKSLGEHWSAGGYVQGESSTYSNLRLAFTLAPAIEYDIFPYSQSTRRQFRILYRIGLTRARYYDETVYLKTAETLLQESLNFAYEVVRPWGKASMQLQGSHYFRNVKFNRLEVEAELEFRIWRGLSLEIDGSYTRIRDLLGLSAEGASLEEILLRQRQLATGYNYSFSVGFNFSFGSTRSNVVNPRFGNGGRSISISM
ncbi:MAG TPA: hypothetical protein VLN41_00200 [Candidatus Bathyarchaeia archaeon]|nr:hypothetical protein [Candidatus Bathyarchaeia archaeon]